MTFSMVTYASLSTDTCHLQLCQLPAFELWTVYKLSLLTCKHTFDEGHVVKIIVYRSLLDKDLFQAFNVVQSIYINCYNTHSIPDCGH